LDCGGLGDLDEVEPRAEQLLYDDVDLTVELSAFESEESSVFFDAAAVPKLFGPRKIFSGTEALQKVSNSPGFD
jgi:hypothetical protein